jgi:hypothetical protein
MPDGITEPPETLPTLPPEIGHRPWSANVCEAHRRLVSFFNSARSALNVDESDPIRLKFHLDRAVNVMVPIINALGQRHDDPLPVYYIQSLVSAVGALVVYLRGTLDGAELQ